jgi:predicted transcriptional regulator YdeE
MKTPFTMLGAVAMALAVSAVSGGDTLTAKIVQEPGFTVVGISARTTNAQEMSGQGVIGKQWERFIKEGLLGRIPHRVDANILAVYTDYESDHNGAYTFILGAKVDSAENVPSGMVVKKVPPGKYALFTSERGRVDQVVPESWIRINTMPKSAPGGDRTYQADFELYGPRAADPKNAQVDIYIGIR